MLPAWGRMHNRELGFLVARRASRVGHKVGRRGPALATGTQENAPREAAVLPAGSRGGFFC